MGKAGFAIAILKIQKEKQENKLMVEEKKKLALSELRNLQTQELKTGLPIKPSSTGLLKDIKQLNLKIKMCNNRKSKLFKEYLDIVYLDYANNPQILDENKKESILHFFKQESQKQFEKDGKIENEIFNNSKKGISKIKQDLQKLCSDIYEYSLDIQKLCIEIENNREKIKRESKTKLDVSNVSLRQKNRIECTEKKLKEQESVVNEVKTEGLKKATQLNQSISELDSKRGEIKKYKEKLKNLGFQSVPEIRDIEENITKLENSKKNLIHNISVEKIRLTQKDKYFFTNYSNAKKDMENAKNKLDESKERFEKILEVHQKALSFLNNIPKDFKWHSKIDKNLDSILKYGQETCFFCSRYILKQVNKDSCLGCGFIKAVKIKMNSHPKDENLKVKLIQNIKNHIQSFESSESKECMQSAINSMGQKYIEKVRNFEHLKTLCEQYDSLNKQLNEKKSNLLREKSIKRLVKYLNSLKRQRYKMVNTVNETASELEKKQANESMKHGKPSQLNVRSSISKQSNKAVNAVPEIVNPVLQSQKKPHSRLSSERRNFSTSKPLSPLKEVDQSTEMRENNLSYSANLGNKKLILQGNTYWCKLASFLTIAINKSKQNLEKLTKLGLDTSQALDSSKNQAFMSYIYNIKGYAPGRERAKNNNTTIANIEKLIEFCKELHGKRTIVLNRISRMVSVLVSFNLNAIQTKELKLIYDSLITQCGTHQINKQEIAPLISYLSGTEQEILCNEKGLHYQSIKDLVPLYNCFFYSQLYNFGKESTKDEKLHNIKELKKMYNYCKELDNINVKIANFIPGSGKDCQNEYLKVQYENIEDKLKNLKKENIKLTINRDFKKYLEKMLKDMEEIMHIFNKPDYGNSMTEFEKDLLHSQLSYINELIPLYNLYTDDHIDFDSINKNLLRENVEEGVDYLMKRRSKFSQEHIEFLNIYLELGCKFSKHYLIPNPSSHISNQLVFTYFINQFIKNLNNPNNYIMLGFKKINHYCVLVGADSKEISVWDPIKRKTTLQILEDKSSLSLPSFETTLEKYYVIE